MNVNSLRPLGIGNGRRSVIATIYRLWSDSVFDTCKMHSVFSFDKLGNSELMELRLMT